MDEICLGWHCSGIVACPHRDRQPWAVVPKALPAIPPLPSLPQPLLASADCNFMVPFEGFFWVAFVLHMLG